MQHSQEQDEFIVFFHNLKFDGSFILNFLNEKEIEYDSFINDMGVWYSITIEFDDFKIVFRDSLKILNFTIQQIGELFDLPIKKGDTPLLDEKPETIKPDWVDYIKGDVSILANAIYIMYFIEGFEKFTSASEALAEFKKTIDFRKWYPILNKETEDFARRAYNGGWVYCNPRYQNQIIEKPIKIFDENSKYPGIAINHYLPVGKPEVFDGYAPIKNHEVAFYHVRLTVSLKEGYLPTFKTKDPYILKELGLKSTDYIETTDSIFYDFYLTNYDLALIFKHYDYDIIFLETHIYQTEKGLLDDYIKKYRYQKEHAKSPSEKLKAKIMLNSLTGKFGAKVITYKKKPYNENGILRFELEEPEEAKPVYVPFVAMMTSIGRYEIITHAQNHIDTFLYSDTDSLHLIDSGRPVTLPIDDRKFGYWALEGIARKGKYIRAKLYLEEVYDGDTDSWVLDCKGAGMTSEIKKQVTFDNFKIGSSFPGKKASKQTKGGMVIYDTEFTISESGRGYF